MNYKIASTLTDEAILGTLGSRIAGARLDKNLSQAELAEEAGISKSTVERIESGISTNLDSFIRILRVLGIVERFNDVLPESKPRPTELLRRKRKKRKRSSVKRSQEDAWTWGADE